jgi:hypothetical protein
LGYSRNIGNKVWGWFEIQYSDIENSCTENNLIPFMEEDFSQVVWVCMIKEK